MIGNDQNDYNQKDLTVQPEDDVGRWNDFLYHCSHFINK